MAGDLEDGVPGGVEDRASRREVLGAELFQDDGPRRRLVAEHAAAGVLFEGTDDLRRKSVRVERERPLDDETHHLPVAGRRVLAGRELGKAAARPRGPAEADEVQKAQPLEIRERRGMSLEDVTQRVAAGIAVGLGVRSGSDAETVADEDDGAGSQSRPGVPRPGPLIRWAAFASRRRGTGSSDSR